MNGNLLTMDQRHPGMSGTPIDMDKLTYTYAAGNNKLIKVRDLVPVASTATLPDFKDKSDIATEYTYDANGNMLTDANKKITAIVYNHMNRPRQITVQDQGTINYYYDAGGRLLRKVITPTSGAVETYDYVGGLAYKNNILQYITNAEGRSRPVYDDASSTTNFIYDYYIKDHLGNIRSTVSAQPGLTTEYLASHEIASAYIENLLFDNIPPVRADRPGGDPLEQAVRLVADDPEKRVGTSIMLKVMPGDRFNINVDAYYEEGTEQQQGIPGEEVIESLLTTLMGGSTYAGVPVSELPANLQVIQQALGQPGLGSFLESLQAEHTLSPGQPKAFLNYLFFNQQMQAVSGLSGSIPVGVTGGGWVSIAPGGPIEVTVPGYFLIFVNNNSIGRDVWFDDLYVGHYNGQVLEQNHYYPFGLTLATTAAGTPEQPYKYNGKELEKKFGLETYDYGARQYDPQIGRWKGVDPLADKYAGLSPFGYVANNPVKYIDPDGRLILNYTAAQLREYGLTKADMTRFENIVNNIYKITENNPQALMAIHNTTGFEISQINKDLLPNNGQTVTIGAAMGAAKGDRSGIVVDPKMIKYLANIDGNEKAELSEQTLGMAMTVLHEYGHLGDHSTNSGKYSGEYILNSKGERDYIINNESIERGAQKWGTSPTGHRGEDIEVIGFGVNFSIDAMGRHVRSRVELSPTTNSKSIIIPQSLPENMQGENILKTLNVE